MKNKLSILLIVATFFGITMTAASAHPGPGWGGGWGNHHYHHFGGPVFVPSISFVIDTTDHHQSVSLAGHVFRQVDDDTYLFTDGSSTYQLDSDSHLPMGTAIVIGGHFNGDGEISVRSWNYINQ